MLFCRIIASGRESAREMHLKMVVDNAATRVDALAVRLTLT